MLSRQQTLARLPRLLALCLLLHAPSLAAFVILSGPERATISGTSYLTPTVTFYWDGSAPPLEGLHLFADGIWSELNDSDAMEQIIQLALQQWNNIPGSYIRLALVKDSEASASVDDRKHAIVVRGDTNASTSAFALPFLEEGKIADCDISISDRQTTATNLAYTITHEIGHCLGLGHNHSNYGAIMGYARSSRILKLGADDRAGIIYLYPDPAYLKPPNELLACGVVAAQGSQSKAPHQSPLWWFLPLLWVSISRLQAMARSQRKPPAL